MFDLVNSFVNNLNVSSRSNAYSLMNRRRDRRDGQSTVVVGF